MMPLSRQDRRWRRALLGASTLTLLSLGCSIAVRADVESDAAAAQTASPIKHVIIIIGENRSFDHLFATYVPVSKDTVKNLLSQGIVNADGTPGPHFNLSQQSQATPPFQTKFFISLAPNQKVAYSTLPQPGLNFTPTTNSDPTNLAKGGGATPPFLPTTDLEQLAAIEPSLDEDDLPLLTTGAATGLTETGIQPDADTRIQNFNALPPGAFPLQGKDLPFDSYTGDTTHRLFEMWQQSDCNIANATPANPSGCLNDLYPFVITTYTGNADNGGGNSMAFYNMQRDDAPVLRRLADEFTTNDNYHQPTMGGTHTDSTYIGVADDFFFTDATGKAATPPSHIADPDPQPGTNNFYKVDVNFDGNFANCSDPTQPGVAAITTYLATLPYNPSPNCVAGAFHIINNASPGFLPDGTLDTAGIAAGKKLGPQSVPTIGEALNTKNISWAYYGGAYNAAVELQHNPTSIDPTVQVGQTYCDICNFENYSAAIMGDPDQRAAHIKDATDFFAALQAGELPSVSYLKPDSLVDGHPASSKWDLFEAMVNNVVTQLRANPKLFAETALFVTVDEGGGYYDSGYIQPLDFFGDGPRIPMVIVSPFTTGGHINHTYNDHASVVKFIERNWGLPVLSKRSRDNLANPKMDPANPYVPLNSPAIGDLFDMFQFPTTTGSTAATTAAAATAAAATTTATASSTGTTNGM